MDWAIALGPSLLVIIGGIITWMLKSRVEELRAIEKKLGDERRKVYAEILDPYIRVFVSLKAEGRDQALKEAVTKITSYEHRKTGFELSLFGSDEVVRAYNAMIQHFVKSGSSGGTSPEDMVRLWGGLLLEIRRSLGSRRTKLDEFDMLAGMISDIDSLRKKSITPAPTVPNRSP